jgi:hypothetical protein
MMSQVSKLLEGLGGDLKNNQALKLLIALLILIALLQQESKHQDPDDALAALGQSLTSSRSTSFSFESTSLEIHQSTSSFTYSSTVVSTQSGGAAPAGGQLDAVA